jgi:phosphoinositide-3-kinase, regulatory subunit 4
MYHDFDKIAFFLGFISDDNKPSDQPTNAPAHAQKSTGKPLPVQIDLPNYSRVHKSQQNEPISSQDGALIFLCFVLSTARNASRAQSKVEACDTILALSERVSDEAKLDRVLPYLISMLNDDTAIVRGTVLRTIAQLVPHPSFQSVIN